MSVFDKFFERYSYKFPKGYPDFTNKQDILILENILDEIGLFKPTPKLILEVINITAGVHETLYTLILDLLQSDKSITYPENLNDLKNQLDNYEKSEFSDEYKEGVTKEKIIKDLTEFGLGYFEDKDINKPFSKVFKSTWEDAKKSAESTYNKLSKFFGGKKIKKVKRVADGESDLGVADNIITLDDGEEVWVSLKKGKGQFNSLSVGKLSPLMFKFGKEDLNSRGELEGDFLLKLDQGEVNKALKAFTDSVNDWVMDNADEKNDKFTNDNLNILLNNPKYNKGQDNLTPSKWKKWHESNPNMKEHKGKRSYIYAKIFELLSTGEQQANREGKKAHLNTAVNDFLSTKSNQLKSNILNILYYILRLNTSSKNPIPSDKGYLYVADGGNKFFKIPSRDQLKSKAKNLELKLGPLKTNKKGEALSDFVKDLEVYGDGKKLADLPIKFRFDKGQWNAGLKVKGDAPTFYDDFITYFNVPEEIEQDLPMN